MDKPLTVKIMYILKVITTSTWVIILPITYAYAWKNPTGIARSIIKLDWKYHVSNSHLSVTKYAYCCVIPITCFEMMFQKVK